MSYTYKLFSAPPVLKRALQRAGWQPAPSPGICHLYWNKRRGRWPVVQENQESLLLKELTSKPEPSKLELPITYNRITGSARFTDKANLQENLKRMKNRYGDLYDFVPPGFIYSEHTQPIVERNLDTLNRSLWICKPSRNSCGRGIFLTNDLEILKNHHQLKNKLNTLEFSNEQSSDLSPQPIEPTNQRKTYIVQRYIDDPFLLSGYKFDLRIYVLVTSMLPLTAYVYQDGLVRFCTLPYLPYLTGNPTDIYRHLCNTSVQRSQYKKLMNGSDNQFANFMKELGCKGTHPKITLPNLFRNFDEIGVDKHAVWNDFKKVILKTLVTFSPLLPNSDPREFNLYGFDLLLDQKLKPWLIEVNLSPSMNVSSYEDVFVKEPLMDDLLKVLVATKLGEQNGVSPLRNIGNFELLSNFKELEGYSEFLSIFKTNNCVKDNVHE
eukprot:TRINITY_DN1767_c0_g1_i1.p1 TRINITY_DN1767_c0_g1~~TRINITY_DN1767_c0_g1_i1.p1  ORF type:complete len:437 (-),score=53.28 TRINITY_DN1767_c0_g1_i1:7-1317(-)